MALLFEAFSDLVVISKHENLYENRQEAIGKRQGGKISVLKYCQKPISGFRLRWDF
jgi:hypothetical protein